MEINAHSLKEKSKQNSSSHKLLLEILKEADQASEKGEFDILFFAYSNEYSIDDVEYVILELSRRAFEVHVNYNVEGYDRYCHLIKVEWT